MRLRCVVIRDGETPVLDERVVEVVGRRGDDETTSVWAWIELYAREDGEWRRVGNASNRHD